MFYSLFAYFALRLAARKVIYLFTDVPLQRPALGCIYAMQCSGANVAKA